MAAAAIFNPDSGSPQIVSFHQKYCSCSSHSERFNLSVSRRRQIESLLSRQQDQTLYTTLTCWSFQYTSSAVSMPIHNTFQTYVGNLFVLSMCLWSIQIHLILVQGLTHFHLALSPSKTINWEPKALLAILYIQYTYIVWTLILCTVHVLLR